MINWEDVRTIRNVKVKHSEHLQLSFDLGDSNVRNKLDLRENIEMNLRSITIGTSN